MTLSKHHIDSLIFLIILFNLKVLCKSNKSSVKNSVYVRKCCPLLNDYVNKSCVSSVSDFETDLRRNYDFDFEFLFGNDCEYGMFEVLLFPGEEQENVDFEILRSGDLRVFSLTGNHSFIVTNDAYCVDYINGENSSISAIICHPGDDFTASLSYGMIISMPFLLATFLVYAILPDRNVHQRALMFYVLTLCMSYILLVTINLSSTLETPWCEILAYATLFFFMVSFFWMNVICFDIWYTFSGGRGFVGSKRSSERRRLLLYSAYAWGVPLLHVTIVFTLQQVLPVTSEHHPGVGITKCFIADGYPNLWYFYAEAAILVVANVTFFLRTAFKIRQVKKETSMLKHNDSKRHAYEKDRQKFNLYLKLLFAMGVNWSMEVISWLVNWQTNNRHTEVWYVTDFFNAVYGVFIFFIFVFKKKIWKLLQKRYYNFVGKPHMAQTMTSSNTRTSHYSSTNYSTADTHLSDRTNGARPEEIGLRRTT